MESAGLHGRSEESGKPVGIVSDRSFLYHQVAPKGEALTCDACHSSKGVLDFEKLGYGEEKTKKLSGGY